MNGPACKESVDTKILDEVIRYINFTPFRVIYHFLSLTCMLFRIYWHETNWSQIENVFDPTNRAIQSHKFGDKTVIQTYVLP